MLFCCLRDISPFYVQVDPNAAGALYDREFIVCSLDLLSGLTEGLGAGIESLVNSTLSPMIYPLPLPPSSRTLTTSVIIIFGLGCAKQFARSTSAMLHG